MGMVSQRQRLQLHSQGPALRTLRSVRYPRLPAHWHRLTQDRGPRSLAAEEAGQREDGPRHRGPRPRRHSQAARHRARDSPAGDTRTLRLGLYVLLQGRRRAVGSIRGARTLACDTSFAMSILAQYRRALAYISPYWRKLVFVAAVSLVSTALGLVQPYISKLLIDEALLRRNMRALVFVAALMVAVTVLGFVFNILSSYRYVQVSAAVLFDMRLAVYRRLQMLSPRFYARTRLGDIVSRINNDIAEVQRVSADTLLASLANLVFLAGSVAIMLWLNWRLFLLSISLLPLSVVALRHYQRRLATHVRTLRERSADIGSFLIETLQGIRLIVTSGAEEHEVSRFRERNRRFIDALLHMQLTSYLAGAAPGAILTLSTAALFLYGGKLVIDGAMTLGTLVAIMAYHLRLLGPVQNLLGLHTNLVTGAVSLSRVFELLDTPVEVIERPDAAPVAEVRGAIIFHDVIFRHDRDAPVLDGVSFEVPAGTICAIIGPSGVGKSTIADLILRLYDPDSGTVRLDGRDLRELRFADLRRAIAIVDQSPYLFHATIRENICY